MPVFVTGGTGYLGRRLVERLTRSGERVTLLVRPSSDTSWLPVRGVDLVPGDVLDRPSLRRAMDGCVHVVHLAALAVLWAEAPDRFYQVNVQGLENVLAVALESGVERIVCTSSVRAIGPTDGTVGDEAYSSHVDYRESPYERSKRQGEKLVAEYVEKGLSATVVSPANVYGPPATRGRIASILRRLYDGRPILTVGDGNRVENYVYIDDVVGGHLLALRDGRAGGRYILGGENLSFGELVAEAARVVSTTPRQVRFPSFLLSILAAIQEAMYPRLGRQPSICQAWVDTWRHDWAYCSAKAEHELGYRAVSVRSGLTLTWAWMQESGLIQ